MSDENITLITLDADHTFATEKVVKYHGYIQSSETVTHIEPTHVFPKSDPNRIYGFDNLFTDATPKIPVGLKGMTVLSFRKDFLPIYALLEPLETRMWKSRALAAGLVRFHRQVAMETAASKSQPFERDMFRILVWGIVIIAVCGMVVLALRTLLA